MEESRFLKTFSVGIDVKRPVAIRPFELVEGDTGNRINVRVTDDGADADLTDCFVTAVFSNSAGISVQDSGHDSVTVSGSTVTIDVDPASFAPGMVECELQIYSSSGGAPAGIEDCDVLVTTAKFNFSCRRAILNGETIELTPQLPILTDIASSIEEAEAARAAAEAERAAAEAERQEEELGRYSREIARRAAENERQNAEAERAEAEAERQQEESVRYSREIARRAAENERQNAEAERAEAETERQQEESERYSREIARRTAESARQSNEQARIAAEAQRQALIAEHLETCGKGVLTGDQDPDSTTAGEPGRLRFSTQSRELFLCTAASATSSGEGRISCEWTALEKSRKWTKIREMTLPEAVAAIEITGDDSGRPFSFDELRLTLTGTMQGSANAAVYLNGLTDKRMTMSTLTNVNTNNVLHSIVILTFEKPVEGFAICEKLYGGENADGSGVAKNVQSNIFGRDGFDVYTAVKLVCTGTNGMFGAGMKAILEGRDVG